MKNLLLCLTVSAFALASSVLADNNANTTKCTKTSADQKTACCESTKDACCSKKASCNSTTTKSACSKGMPSRVALLSPKAAADAGK